jgi:hypothetical protein
MRRSLHLMSRRRAVAALMALVLIWPTATPLAAGGGEPVIVTLGEPSVWSLEQAHYLLERMHAVNHGLSSKVPDPDALDPNAVNSSRIEVLRTLFAAGVEFNQPLAAESQAKLETFQSSLDRRRSLQTRLDEARGRRQAVTIQLATLRAELSRLTAVPGASAELRQRRTEEITALEAEKTALDAEITALQTEVQGLTVTAPELDAPQPSLGGTGGAAPALSDQSPVLTEILKGIGTGNRDPQLHVSAVLDNHIQMQYELIAKQISLLRDEVGPDQRVLFLELPVSIYTVPKKGDRRLVRVKWTIQEVCGNGFEAALSKLRDQRRKDAREAASLERARDLAAAAEMLASEEDRMPKLAEVFQEAPAGSLAADDAGEVRALKAADFLNQSGFEGVTGLLEQCDKPADRARLVKAARYAQEDKIQEAAQELERYVETTCREDSSTRQTRAPSYEEVTTACDTAKWKQSPRYQVVDLVPRQSALNVNQIYDTSTGISLALKALWFGWGAAAQFQRQRERFEQFVYQDVFGSGFGKGEKTFGWTFGPLPGTERIAPGVRTTYAVVVVPRDAVALKLRGEKVAFRMRESPDEVAPTADEFTLRLPTLEDGFYVRRISYAPVEPGKRITAFLTGEGFSQQMGVLVNGVPLQRAISIGRPALVPAAVAAAFAGAPHEGIDGQYEVVNSHRVILSFSAGPTYVGTPTIVLVTPQKSSAINYYRLTVNGRRCTSLMEQNRGQPMFLPRLSVTGIELACSETNGAKDCVEVLGGGFRPGARIWVNGTPLMDPHQISTVRYRGTPQDPNKVRNKPLLEVTVRQGTRQGLEEASVRVPRPNLLRVLGAEIMDVVQGDKPGSGALHLRVEVASDTPEKVTAEVVGRGKVEPILLSTGELFFKDLTFDNHRLLLELKEGGTAGSALLPVVVPAAPRVAGVKASTTGEAKGSTAGNYLVTIRGSNLQDVKRVFIGSGFAAIEHATPTELVVKAPTGTAGTVRIRLETDIRFLGRLLDNSDDPQANISFTYVAPAQPAAPAPA